MCMCYDFKCAKDTNGLTPLKPKSKAHRGGPQRLGYLHVYLGTKDKKPEMEYAHRLVLYSIYGPPPDEESCVAMHTCNNPGCLNPHHLVWGSDLDNRLKGGEAEAKNMELLMARMQGLRM